MLMEQLSFLGTGDANGAGVSNTAGSITSTVSANTTSGFSIVTYTGTWYWKCNYWSWSRMLQPKCSTNKK
jgi:hypothetical protein